MGCERARNRTTTVAAMVVAAAVTGALTLVYGPAPGAPAAPEPAGSSGPGRYVVLGDSVPYGHGLANPGTAAHGGLAPDQGPSVLAWPSLVQAALPGLAPLAVRPTGCTLTRAGRVPYDQLAISGAPAGAGPWTGPDGDCGRSGTVAPPHHRAVSPDELDAAGLAADPPALVTLQAGADDIDFAGCLEALLGVPAVLGADPCVTRGPAGLQLTPTATAELDGLRDGLRAALRAVDAAAPGAQVLLVDYYQPLPPPTAPVTGGSLICAELRAGAHLGTWRSVLRARADYVQQQLNDAIGSVATAFPAVRLIDIARLFAGHEMCTATPWVFAATWDAAHPNATGQQQIAAAVLARCATLARRCVGR